MSALYQIEGVCRSYLVGKVAVDALRGVDLEMNPGEMIAFQGPSGSGKSTLLNIVGLIDTPSQGKLHFEGVETTELSEQSLTKIRRRAIGFIFQNFNLIPVLSALENVEFSCFLDGSSSTVVRQRSLEVLQQVGLEEYIHHKPAESSGGQRQRVAIARALVKKPKVIIADEPTANLDSKTAEQIVELLVTLQNEMTATVIMATHDQATAAAADRIITLRDGLLV